MKQVYVYAIAHGEKVDNPADSVGAASIATFVPEDRALSPLEIRLFGAADGIGGDLSDHQAGAAPDPADAGTQRAN